MERTLRLRERPAAFLGATATGGQLDARKLVALALPVGVPLAMAASFTVARDRLGDQAGYLAGFVIYWGTCAGLSFALLGRRRIAALYRGGRRALRSRRVATAVLLLWPPVGAIATRFLPEITTATPTMIATIFGVALANATLEELLWRGVYVSFWPQSRWLGWLWPAIGFGAWHLAPQVIRPASAGPVVYVLAATALGLSWGWVAWTTGTLRRVTVSHVLTDGSGLRNALFFIGG